MNNSSYPATLYRHHTKIWKIQTMPVQLHYFDKEIQTVLYKFGE